MTQTEKIRCRVAACREHLADGNAWSFYLINDSSAALDSATLTQVDYEWGDMGNSETADVTVTNLPPGASILIWRDDGSGAELRMSLRLTVHMYGRDARLSFEFPKLYIQRNLVVVDPLGKLGWPEAAEA